jgi:hypothetical protein
VGCGGYSPQPARSKLQLEVDVSSWPCTCSPGASSRLMRW